MFQLKAKGNSKLILPSLAAVGLSGFLGSHQSASAAEPVISISQSQAVEISKQIQNLIVSLANKDQKHSDQISAELLEFPPTELRKSLLQVLLRAGEVNQDVRWLPKDTKELRTKVADILLQSLKLEAQPLHRSYVGRWLLSGNTTLIAEQLDWRLEQTLLERGAESVAELEALFASNAKNKLVIENLITDYRLPLFYSADQILSSPVLCEYREQLLEGDAAITERQRLYLGALQDFGANGEQNPDATKALGHLSTIWVALDRLSNAGTLWSEEYRELKAREKELVSSNSLEQVEQYAKVLDLLSVYATRTEPFLQKQGLAMKSFWPYKYQQKLRAGAKYINPDQVDRASQMLGHVSRLVKNGVDPASSELATLALRVCEDIHYKLSEELKSSQQQCHKLTAVIIGCVIQVSDADKIAQDTIAMHLQTIATTFVNKEWSNAVEAIRLLPTRL